MPGEPVQDGLPTLALNLRFVFGLGLKCLLYKDTGVGMAELNPQPSDHLLTDIRSAFGHDSRVRALKVESLASVPRFHPR